MAKQITYVVKSDGTQEKFSIQKLERTVRRLNLNQKTTPQIVQRIVNQLKEGETTQKILKIIYKEIKKEVKHKVYRVDLRKAIQRLLPSPDFEIYIGYVLQYLGYSMLPSQVLKGQCVEHEVDGIAQKDGLTFTVEVKHHQNPYVFTGIDVVRNTWAILQDFQEGYSKGLHKFDFSNAIIVCNTRFSENAIKYGKCQGIQLIGWQTKKLGLEKLIQNKKLFPITVLPNLSKTTQKKLVSARILSVRQLIRIDPSIISQKTKISLNRVRLLQKQAEGILKL
jgi:hypothetical protein